MIPACWQTASYFMAWVGTPDSVVVVVGSLSYGGLLLFYVATWDGANSASDILPLQCKQ